ncbi:MAG: hypothetical protein ACOYK1_02620 [Vampirovibrionia bacterium]
MQLAPYGNTLTSPTVAVANKNFEIEETTTRINGADNAPNQIEEKRLVLESLLSKLADGLKSDDSSQIKKAQIILEDNTTLVTDLIKELNKQKVNKEDPNSNSLLDICIDTINQGRTDNKLTKEALLADNSTADMREDFIHSVRSLVPYPSKVITSSNKNGDSSLQSEIYIGEKLSETISSLVNYLKEGSNNNNNLDLMLNTPALTGVGSRILWELENIANSKPLEGNSSSKESMEVIRNFLKQVEAENESRIIDSTDRAASMKLAASARLTNSNTDPLKCHDKGAIDDILYSDSDEKTLKAITALAKKYDSNEVAGFNYIMGEKFRKQIAHDYGGGYYGEIKANAVSDSIRRILNEAQGSSKGLDSYLERDLIPEATNAYTALITEQKKQLGSVLDRELVTLSKKINALDTNAAEKINITNDAREIFTLAKGIGESISHNEDNNILRDSSSELFKKITTFKLKTKHLEEMHKSDPSEANRKKKDIAKAAEKIVLDHLHYAFRDFNVSAGGVNNGNTNYQSLIHERTLDHLLPDRSKDSQGQYSITERLGNHILETTIDQALAEGKYSDPDSAAKLNNIRTQKDIGSLKDTFTDLYNRVSNAFGNILQDIYESLALGKGERIQEKIKERMSNSTNESAYAEIIRTSFDKLTLSLN